MEYKNIIYEKDGSIIRITLNRPEKMNAISVQLNHELVDAIGEVDKDDDVKVVILKGAGPCFSSGYDLSEVGHLYGWKEPKPGEKVRPPSQRTRLRADRFTFYEAHSRLLLCQKLTIAQVHGYCTGGALTTVLHCDFIIASEDCKLGHVEERMGFAGVTISPIFILRTGLTRALELCITGKAIDGLEASRIGLVNRAVPVDKLEAEVNELAQGLARYPKDGIAFGKIQRHLIYDMMGVTKGFAPAYVVHSFLTNMRWEPGEYNFLKERREKGVREAAHGKHDFYKDLDK